ncbi:MAG TPA: hypothetical protein PKJ63_14775 [Cyclobacteriaceae bacterium]|nr:hypothetical protein [Cyclobacteriaceae bacterium]
MRPLLFISIVLLCSCRTAEEEPSPLPVIPAPEDADVRVLFVGNSLTFFNDLPALVSELGAMDGIGIYSESITKPNYSLQDHWNEATVRTAIETRKFDLVIAQQGPSALPESQVLLLNYATLLANHCKDNDTQLAMYMVWPSKERSFDHDNVIYSYTQAAEKTGSLLCPAGLAWKYAWKVDPDLPLYTYDFFHPGVMGSVLAAMTIYGAIEQKSNFDFIDRSRASWKNEVHEEALAILKEAAIKALTE